MVFITFQISALCTCSVSQLPLQILLFANLIYVTPTVYQVETGHYYRVERRYSAFHSLNKQAKKLGLGPLSEFPPKRIRSTSAKVLKSRRKGLEHFIQVSST